MTEAEYKAAAAQLNDLESTAAELRRAEREGIDTAREINARVRAAQAKLRQVDEQAGSLRPAIREYERAEAERKAAEAKATEPQA